MKIVQIGAVTVYVKNLDEAIARFTDVFGLEFVKLRGASKESKWVGGDRSKLPKRRMKMAIDKTGYFELVQTDPPVEKEGIGPIHFRVENIEKATEELKKKGLKNNGILVDPVGFKEAGFGPENLHGVHLLLTEYKGQVLTDVLKNSTGDGLDW